MLVLNRKRAESIKIGDNILIKVIETRRGLVKLGIEAPPHIRVLRSELTEFATVPATGGREGRNDAEMKSENSSESTLEDECYRQFANDDAHNLEVETLMWCAGTH